MMRALEQLLAGAIEARDGQGLLRDRRLRRIDGAVGPRVEVGGLAMINFASNGYLGLSLHPRVVAALGGEASRAGTSATASRLVGGNAAVLGELERALAAWKGTEDAVLFPSGYQANVGVLQALGSALGGSPLILSDALNHASIVDGCRLARAEIEVYAHCDAEDAARRLEQAHRQGRRAVIVTESRFSMDGDLAPLERLAELAEVHEAALVVDEAHATGIDGDGRGLVHALGIGERVDAIVGTLGKALGAQGAFVAGSARLVRWVENAGRTFVYSTALAPPLAAAAKAALSVLEEERPDRALWRNIAVFEDALRSRGLSARIRSGVSGPIFPIVTGSPEAALSAQAFLEQRGMLAVAIRPPTVPAGTSRIRLSLRADHTETDLIALADALAAAPLGHGG
jgi:8-amino-7-oxononanoate synthase